MAVVQTSYAGTMRPGTAGLIANMTEYDVDTRIVETVAGIGFGLAVGQGSADKGAVLGAAAAAGFVGVSVRDVTLLPVASDKYPRYANIGVLTEGDIWVVTGGAVTAGADATFDSTTGVLSSAATSGTQLAIAGARWMTTAASGALAILRLGGALPAA